MPGLAKRITVLSALCLMPVFSAQAAPQILGLLATAAPVALTCEGGVCTAELSAFCLQEKRPIPKVGTAYLPAPGTRITLQIAGGPAMDVAVRARVASTRDFAAVRVSLPEALVRTAGSGPATLSVGRHASLIPVARPGDADPLTAGEIARLTGPLRTLAAPEASNSDARAARLINRLINTLPADAPASAAERDAAWQRALGPELAEAPRRVHRAARDCRTDFNKFALGGMRACLAHHHDDAMVDVTRGVWKRLRPGS
jgi:hypothetical protein